MGIMTSVNTRTGYRKETTDTMWTIRGELRCIACSRYLGDFESHPERHGKGDLHLVTPKAGALPQHAVATEAGLRCSRCGGRVVTEMLERVAA
jgi:DNA-directed RNA polymerase subunit RPC12/RpoP